MICKYCGSEEGGMKRYYCKECGKVLNAYEEIKRNHCKECYKECGININDVISELRGKLRSVVNMPCHVHMGRKCCGIFTVIKKDSVFCNKCGMNINDAISELYEKLKKNE